LICGQNIRLAAFSGQAQKFVQANLYNIREKEPQFMLKKTREDRIRVACVDCPRCGKENVVARVASARSGFNSTVEHTITCKQCLSVFTLHEYELQISRHPREVMDAEYGVATLPWIE
jgi:transposase-like protein